MNSLHRWLCWATLASVVSACKDEGEISQNFAKAHVLELAPAARTDVSEIRNGLPSGAKCLEAFFNRATLGPEDAEDARAALTQCQNKVQDLRVAKSTFFAAVTTQGNVIRNDRDQDLMAGKNLFSAYPELRQALAGKYVESQGSLLEASGVKGRHDAQWVAAEPVKVEGVVRGLYVTGWSWSAYAYRLEFALRNAALSALGEREKAPLLYVYVLVGDAVFGAPISPVVNAQEIARLRPLVQATEKLPFSARLEITGRTFGLAVLRTPVLGKNVAIAVLRSET